MTSTTSISTRDFLTAVINGDTLTTEHIDKAKTMLEALDKRNAARKSADSKEKREVAERKALVAQFFTTHEGEFTRDEIAAVVGLTPSQVSSACKTLIAENVIEKSTAKRDKSTKVVYVAIVADSNHEE